MLEEEIERIERFFLCVCYFSGLKFCRIICLISEVLKGLTRALMAKSNSGLLNLSLLLCCYPMQTVFIKDIKFFPPFIICLIGSHKDQGL